MRFVINNFHKINKISVTLSAGTGGAAVFNPAIGTSYTLSALPIGTRIVKSTDTLYSLSDANGNSVGTITLVASSGYNADEVSITRGGVKTTIGIVPIILKEGDSITADFEAITMRIKFYNNSLGTFYNNLTGQSIPDGGYADVPRADVLRFSPSGTNDGAIEIFKDGLWTPTIIYMYSGQQAYILAEPALVQRQPIDFAPEPGYTYEFPAMWNLQDGYQYLDGSLFAFQNSPTPPCDLVELKDYSIYPVDFRNYIDYYISNNYSYIQQVQWQSPQNGECYYATTDGHYFYFLAYGDAMFVDTSHQMRNSPIIVALVTDNMTDWYCTFYDLGGGLNYFYGVPEWNSASGGLAPNYNVFGSVYQNGDTSDLEYWLHNWDCSDVCDLNTIIYNLATNK